MRAQLAPITFVARVFIVRISVVADQAGVKKIIRILRLPAHGGEARHAQRDDDVDLVRLLQLVETPAAAALDDDRARNRQAAWQRRGRARAAAPGSGRTGSASPPSSWGRSADTPRSARAPSPGAVTRSPSGTGRTRPCAARSACANRATWPQRSASKSIGSTRRRREHAVLHQAHALRSSCRR